MGNRIQSNRAEPRSARNAFMAGYKAGRQYAKKAMRKRAEDRVTCPPKSISDFKKVDESEFYAIQPHGDFNDIGDCYVYMDGYGYSYWVYELCDSTSDNYGVWCYSIDIDGEADFWYPGYAVEEPFATKEEALKHMLEQVPLLYDNITDKRLAYKHDAFTADYGAGRKYAKQVTRKRAMREMQQPRNRKQAAAWQRGVDFDFVYDERSKAYVAKFPNGMSGEIWLNDDVYDDEYDAFLIDDDVAVWHCLIRGLDECEEMVALVAQNRRSARKAPKKAMRKRAMPWALSVPELSHWDRVTTPDDGPIYSQLYVWDCGQNRCFLTCMDEDLYQWAWIEVPTSVANFADALSMGDFEAVSDLLEGTYEEGFSSPEEARDAFADWWASDPAHRHTARRTRRL